VEALKHKLPDFWLPSLTPTYTSTGPPQSLLASSCRQHVVAETPHILLRA
jgi:hypothetical protein